MSKRIDMMRERLVTDKNPICIEKFKVILETEAENAYEMPVYRRGKTLANFLDRVPIFIMDGELIVGNTASKPFGLEMDVGFSIWNKFELDALKEDGFKLEAKDEAELLALFERYPQFGCTSGMNRIMLGHHHMEPYYRSGMTLPPWRDSGVSGGTASSGLGLGPGWLLVCPDYNLPVNKGLNAMIEECEEELQLLRFFDTDSYEKSVSLQAMKMCLEALVRFAGRFAALARQMAEQEKDGERKKELLEIAETCRRVPAYPARTFKEALQTVWFIFLVTSPSPTTCIGRFDQYMYPFYKADIEAGRITDEEVLEYLECFRLKVMEISNISGKEVRKRGVGRARWYNMTIGGVKSDGSDATNELSYLVLEALMRCPTTHHTITMRVAESTPESLILKGIEAQARGLSMPAFIGDPSYINFFTTYGVSLEHARDYVITGCLDANLPGRSRAITIGMFITPLMLEFFLNDGVDRKTGLQVGNKVGDLDRFKTYDEFYAAFIQEFTNYMSMGAERNNAEAMSYGYSLPNPLMSALMVDGIKIGLDVYKRPYELQNNNLMNPVGMVNLGNSLFAIKKLVYEAKVVTLSEFKRALDANWVGYEDLHKKCLKLPKYGNDIPEVDGVVGGVYDHWARIANALPAAYGGTQKPTAISVTSHQPGGAITAATPDGRCSGDILADGCASPASGTDTNGPLAVFKSALNIPQDGFAAMLLNMKFHPSALKTEEDKKKLASAMKAYFFNGGKQVQFNVVDSEALREAQRTPDEHKDIMVRVAGFSAYFVHLTKEIQNEVIDRTVHNL
ncbi:MAG TPA: pyruvate formate lyase family protein [Syntrophorhabdaceae bacterium]|nr:pyruvate formate lyase family protein [Syntrophorhabdaceae bacterium]